MGDGDGEKAKRKRGEKPKRRVACKVSQPLIYTYHGRQYDELVGYQDHHGNLKSAIDGLFGNVLNAECTVADLGAGSGRLAAMVAGRVKAVRLLDSSQHMLDIARQRLEGLGHENCTYHVADHIDLHAIEDHSIDVIMAGWTLCHLKKPVRPWKDVSDDDQHYWREDLDKAFAEMRRILTPGGHVVVFETLGTAVDAPQRNSYYYAMLQDMGFDRTELRTDYLFPDMQTAKDMANFFWGPKTANRITDPLVPEFTAMFVWRNAFSAGSQPH